MGAGKTTVQKALIDLIQKQCDSGTFCPALIPLALATPVKALIQEILQTMGIDTSAPNWKIKHREQLQALGHGMRRFSPDCWVDILSKTIDGIEPRLNLVFVDDVRYPNEVAALQQRGLYVVRLQASAALRGKRIPLINQDNPGESALDNYADFDMVIDEDDCGYEDMGVTYARMILAQSRLLWQYGIVSDTQGCDAEACASSLCLTQDAGITA